MPMGFFGQKCLTISCVLERNKEEDPKINTEGKPIYFVVAAFKAFSHSFLKFKEPFRLGTSLTKQLSS